MSTNIDGILMIILAGIRIFRSLGGNVAKLNAMIATAESEDGRDLTGAEVAELRADAVDAIAALRAQASPPPPEEPEEPQEPEEPVV